jgi:hypothetical protein
VVNFFYPILSLTQDIETFAQKNLQDYFQNPHGAGAEEDQNGANLAPQDINVAVVAAGTSAIDSMISDKLKAIKNAQEAAGPWPQLESGEEKDTEAADAQVKEGEEEAEEEPEVDTLELYNALSYISLTRDGKLDKLPERLFDGLFIAYGSASEEMKQRFQNVKSFSKLIENLANSWDADADQESSGSGSKKVVDMLPTLLNSMREGSEADGLALHTVRILCELRNAVVEEADTRAAQDGHSLEDERNREEQRQKRKELHDSVRQLFTERNQDARYLIPLANFLTVEEIVSALPKFTALPEAELQELFDGVNYTVLIRIFVALHNLEEGKDGVTRARIKATLETCVVAIRYSYYPHFHQPQSVR